VARLAIHSSPVKVDRTGCSPQFGRTSAPMIPQPVLHHRQGGPDFGTAEYRAWHA
jgi:hypothetical protein